MQNSNQLFSGAREIYIWLPALPVKRILNAIATSPFLFFSSEPIVNLC